jgi:hypothetical protein
MTKGEAKSLALHFLKGDNSNAEITDFIIQQSILEVATRCEPRKLYVSDVDGSTKIYRKLYDEDGKITGAIKYPANVGDDEELDIDSDLHLAVVFFVCAYFSHKSKDYYEMKAERLISLYKSNSNL